MDILETIYSRRSVRKFQDKKVPDDFMEKILKAGMSAPSAGNEQPWQFVIISEKKILEKIPQIHPNAGFVKDAPVAILICGDLGLEKHKGFWVQDCSAATQNMLIAANALGLGAVWIGIYPREDRINGFKKMFNTPENIVPFSLIPIGYPTTKPSKLDRFKIERIHHEKW